MKVSMSWIVPAGQVWLVRQGEIIAKKRLREKLDGIAFDELIVNGTNARDTIAGRVP
jgi:hypothetical protein